jgi:outer membrane immunogenic protein
VFATFDTNGSSFIGGGHVGYNYQWGQVVLGAEGDLQWLNINASAQCSTTVGSVCNTKQNTLGSIRGRIGYAGFDRFLVYATGGVALTRYSFAETALFLQSWGSSTRTGWTVGDGVEYAITNNWIAGVEFRYYDFSNQTLASNITGGLVNFKETESTLVGRVSYKF